MAGGALGTGARYAVQLAAARWTLFPWGTLTVNALGCLAIGVLGRLVHQRDLGREELRLLLITGFLGGFTTFSAFGYDTFSLWRTGQARLALLNIVSNNALGLLAVALGWWAVGRLWGH